MSSTSDIKKILAALPDEQRGELMGLLEQLDVASKGKASKTNFMSFVHEVWPDFIEGPHHRIMADAFNRIATGKLKRLIVCMPPRHTKSEFASFLLPAWYLGLFPKHKVMQVSNTAELAQGFGRKVRNLFKDKVFRDTFANVKLSADSTAAGRWNTNQGGEYFAVGVNGTIAGKGGNLLVIDDPHTEAEALASESGDHSVYDRVFSWYSLVRQRLQPGAAVVIVMTRWSMRDLVGQITKQAEANGRGDDWEIIEFPAILPSGNPLWPQFWPLKELEALREELPIQRWSAQYQQNPISVAAALIKKSWWREWDEKEHGKPPNFEYIIQSWDTASTANTRSNYSACTTWGMFLKMGPGNRMYPQFMLIDSFRDRLEFPDLKKEAKRLYGKYKPDCLLIESTAQGTSLIPELRAAGLPVTPFMPGRQKNDKILRVNAISDVFKMGQVWYIDNQENRKVIEQFEAFPNAQDGDDYVDSGSQAIATARAGGVIRLTTDEDFDNEDTSAPGNRYYSVF